MGFCWSRAGVDSCRTRSRSSLSFLSRYFFSRVLFLFQRLSIVCRNRRNRRIPFHVEKSKFSVEILTETFIVFSCKWIQRKTDHRLAKTRKSDQDLRGTNEINFDDAAKKSLDDTNDVSFRVKYVHSF